MAIGKRACPSSVKAGHATHALTQVINYITNNVTIHDFPRICTGTWDTVQLT